MGNILSIIIVASAFFIWYFWKKKPNKKFFRISLIVLILSSVLFPTTKEYKDNQKQEASEKIASSQEVSSVSESKKAASEKAESDKKASEAAESKKNADAKAKESSKKHEATKVRNTESSSGTKSTKEKSSSSSNADNDKRMLLKRAKKLKYMMPYDEVKKIMKVTPTTDNKDESGYQTLEYGNGIVILGFDENNKLNQGTEGAPQIEKQAQSSIKKAKEESSNNRERKLSFAKTFGQKPVEKLQKLVGIVYASTRVGDSMYYMWDTDEKGVGKLIRVDDPQQFTTVYEYDKNGRDGLLGKELYSGRTIINKPGTTYIYQ
ncbi:hypothetical protein AB9M75_07985 [Lactobacillus sp. AN1001]